MTGILIPQHIFVGDAAQFFFLLSEQEYTTLIGSGFTVDIPIPLKNITQNDVMTVHEVRIVKREAGHYLAITFTPWETGDIDFPALPFLPLKNKLLAVSVSSLLGTGERISLQPPKPPLLLPGTDFLLYGVAILSACFLAALGTGALLLIRKLRKKTIGTAKKRLALLRKQLKKLYKEARKIQKRLQPHSAAFSTSSISMDARAIVGGDIQVNPDSSTVPIFTDEVSKNMKSVLENWYADVDRCLRKYIQALCMDNAFEAPAKDKEYFFSATYRELTETLMDIFTAKPEITDLFCIFYVMLERQRFGSSPAELIRNYTAISQDMLKRIPRIAEKTEIEYAALSHLANAITENL